MASYGPLLWVAFALGVFLLFVGIVTVSIAFAAPLAYYVNLLDVRSWTHDYLGVFPWVGPGHEYASAATFTVVFVLLGVCIAGIGVLLVSLPGVLLG